MAILYCTFGFKIFKSICFIVILSYFLGILFYIFTDIIEENKEKETKLDMLDPSSRHLLGFIDAYFKNDDTLTKRVVILLYFSFTSLTTVGFGDFVPKSDFERIFTALLIFSGVGVFSFFVGNFALALDGFYRL